MTRAGKRRASALSGVLLAGLLLLASCGGTEPGSSQERYRVRLAADRGALTNGVLEYPSVGSLKVDSRYAFTATVTGAQASGSISPAPSHTIHPRPVHIGGVTGVRLSCAGIGCTALSSERQSILSAEDHAQWTWTLTSDQPGTAHVSLVVTTYDQDTSTVLWESPPIEQDISVTATPSYQLNRVADWVKASTTLIGASAIGGLALAVWRRIRRTRADDREKPDPSGTTSAEPATETDDRTPQVDESAPVERWQPPP